jgi:tRNA-dihydrouridine synthase
VSDATRTVASESPALEERFRVMLDHAKQFEAILDQQCFPRMRKHLGWYCKGFPGAAAMRAAMVRASSSEDVARIVAEHQAGHQTDTTSRAATPTLEAAAPVA